MVKSVEMTCPICGEQHNLELRTRKNKITIKGEEVEYETHDVTYCQRNVMM